MLEIERVLAERLGWNLYDMDRTDIESLIPFITHLAGRSKTERLTPCDQTAL